MQPVYNILRQQGDSHKDKQHEKINNYHLNYQMSKHKAIMAMNYYLQQRYGIFYLHNYQDKKKGKNKLNIPQN